MAKREYFKDWILFEDEDYILINKPSGISSLKERGNTESSNILDLCRQYLPETTLCHRIDKYTSGALLIAKNDEALRNASMQFQKKQVKKVYHALVHGLADFKETLVDLPILIDERNRKVRIDKQYGKKSKTIFNTIKQYKDFTLVECTLESGRMHQIRVHLSHLNFPIVGDHLYGGKDVYLSDIKHKFNYNRTGEEQPLMKRFALHAFQLGFVDLKGESLEFEVPYPKDFKVLEKQIEKHNRYFG
jgi:23S rRNA pseudouridine955/2504/2580 synthase